MTTADIGVLLPLRIETRFRNGDLWLRVVPDEPWFVRDDGLISEGELAALARYVDASQPAGPDESGGGQTVVPQAFRELAAQVGAPRAAALVRRFVTTGADGDLHLVPPDPGQLRQQPSLPRIEGFPAELAVWAVSPGSGPQQVLVLTVDRQRLLADFADPDVSGDRRWWQDWDEAVAVGVAGIVPAAALPDPIEALLVTGIGSDDPADLFGELVSEGRVGLLAPGTPTNSVAGEPAAPLATDADTWWAMLTSPAGPAARDVSTALTGDPARLGSVPGGDQTQRATSSALVTALWPALWGFAASQVWDVARGRTPAQWAGRALFPEGAYPSVRVGPQPYGLLPTTSWSTWSPADDDPPLEAGLIRALLPLQARHAAAAESRGTAGGQTTDGLLDLLSDTPSSSRFRFRPAWPLELWWLGMASSALPAAWRDVIRAWDVRYGLAAQLELTPLRRYGARGASRVVQLPLVVPAGASAADVPGLLSALATAATEQPSAFANTAQLEAGVLGGHGNSILLRLVIRSLQLALGDIGRVPVTVPALDLEPFSRNDVQPARLEQLIASLRPVDPSQTSSPIAHLVDITTALTVLAGVPVPELERSLRATIDASCHRIDPWLVALAQRRLDDLTAQGCTRRLGAYGWVDGPAPGTPGPTTAGLLHAPSPSQALTSAVLRDRAVSDPSGRWDLDVTSLRARTADRLAGQVRLGAHLPEVVGREIERIVGSGVEVQTLRTSFPMRTEHAGRRVCDGLAVLAANPFPVTLTADQQVEVDLLRAALDTYGDLLVAEAVTHLADGRSDIAGTVMDGAAGLTRPPDFAILHTPREGRAVATTVLAVLPGIPDLPPPTADATVLDPPATRLDPSVAAFLATSVGAGADWDFQVTVRDAAGNPAGPGDPSGDRVTLADLGLGPAEALALTRTQLERLAGEEVVRRRDLDLRAVRAEVTGGSGPDRYEQGARLVGLLGRGPAGPQSLSEATAPPADDPLDGLVARMLQVRASASVLADALAAQTALFEGDAIGSADPVLLAALVRATTAWGIAPDPPTPLASLPADTAADARVQRLVDVALRALPQLRDRLAAAPADPAAAAALGRSALLAAAAALVAPTGQVAIAGAVAAQGLPALQPGQDLDAGWLTVTAAVREPLARLEVHQLSAATPFASWSNRPADVWQTLATDGRRLLAVYAAPGLDLTVQPVGDGSGTAGAGLAAVLLDRFSEVVPAADQRTGAAFGFDAPASRAPQAILLAVPPQPDAELDQAGLAQILLETRQLAHARMARPVDLDNDFWGLAPTGLLPATGSIATPLVVRS